MTLVAALTRLLNRLDPTPAIHCCTCPDCVRMQEEYDALRQAIARLEREAPDA